jgi:hypothetical protein
MHRPVGPASLTELPGSVQRVNDPGPLGGQPGRIVLTFLGQHRVTRAQPGQLGHQVLVGEPVAGGAQAAGVAALGPERKQALARPGGEIARETVIVGRHQPGTPFLWTPLRTVSVRHFIPVPAGEADRLGEDEKAQ